MPTNLDLLTRREWILQQIGIIQYTVRRPFALCGVAITLPNHVRLLMIAQQQPNINAPLLQDILRSMSLTANHVSYLSPTQALMLTNTLKVMVWLVGDVRLPESLNDYPLILVTPELSQLATKASAKQALWQQICQYEHYFQSHLTR